MYLQTWSKQGTVFPEKIPLRHFQVFKKSGHLKVQDLYPAEYKMGHSETFF